MGKLKSFIKLVFVAIISFIVAIAFFILIGVIQTKLFVPKDYIIWILKSPYSRLAFIYQYLVIFWLLGILNKDGDSFIYRTTEYIKKYAKPFIVIFLIANIVLIYTILFNVSVISENKIIDYKFFSPGGNEYTFNDIEEINTGVYGKKGFTHSKGDFYYIIELNDGSKIDLAEMGGSKNDEDPRFIIEKLDIQYVDMGIHKVSSIDNIEYTIEHLDKTYIDKIKNILLNTN